MKGLIWDRGASASANREFLSIRSYSGYIGAFVDPTAPEQVRPPNATDEELGVAVRRALSDSRILPIEEAEILRTSSPQIHADWVERTIARVGYPNKNAMFREMVGCVMFQKADALSIIPTNHNRLDGWQHMPDEAVVIAAESSPADVGAALKLAFGRCRGRGAVDYDRMQAGLPPLGRRPRLTGRR